MSGEALYERYKDALKRGHVASLRGRLDEALDAYAEASSIAPERPTPHASAGTALLRRRRPADALRYYEAALRLAPRDETALLGRAQSLAALGRRPSAADAFDALAEVRASDGKLADAVDAARRGLELAEGRERRRTLERLIERLRASEPGEPGRVALERALIVLEGPAALGGTAGASPGPHPQAEPGTQPEPATEAQPAQEPEGPAPVRGALDRDVSPDASLDELTRLAEAAADAGRPEEGLEHLLDLAAANRRLGHMAAALDACYGALSLDPDNLGLHLALVELYGEHGWTTLAAEKLDLLDRLAVLDDDAEGAVRVSAARAGHA
jgi:tetratricopeptide (TPR) repeat protein